MLIQCPSVISSFVTCCLKLDVIDVTTVVMAVTSRAAPTRRASSTSSPVRMADVCPVILYVMGTMTAETSLMNWSTCATRQHPHALLESSDVTMDTVSP